MKRYLIIAPFVLAIVFSLTSCKGEEEFDHTHVPAAAVVENKVEAGFDFDGNYDSVEYCSICGQEIGRSKVTTPMFLSQYPEDLKQLYYSLSNIANNEYTVEELATVITADFALVNNAPLANRFIIEQVYGMYLYENIDVRSKYIKLADLLAFLGKSITNSEELTTQLDFLFNQNITQQINEISETDKKIIIAFSDIFEENLLPEPDGTVTKSQFYRIFEKFEIERDMLDNLWWIMMGNGQNVSTNTFLMFVNEFLEILDNNSNEEKIGTILLIEYIVEDVGRGSRHDFQNYETFYNLINKNYTHDNLLDTIKAEFSIYYEIITGGNIDEDLQESLGRSFVDMDTMVQQLYVMYMNEMGQFYNYKLTISQISEFIVTKIEEDVMLDKLDTYFLKEMFKALSNGKM